MFEVMALQDANFVLLLFFQAIAKGVPKFLCLVTAGDQSEDRQRLANLYHNNCKQ